MCFNATPDRGRDRISGRLAPLRSLPICTKIPLPCPRARRRPTCRTSSLAEFGANASYVADLLNRYRANPVRGRRRVAALLPGAVRRARAGAVSFRAAAAPPLRPRVRPGGRGSRRRRRRRRARAICAAPPRGSPRTCRRASTVPTATTQRQIPIKLLDENRRLINEARAAGEQSKISFTHLISWAVIQGAEGLPGDERRVRRRPEASPPASGARRSVSASPWTSRSPTARARSSSRTSRARRR